MSDGLMNLGFEWDADRKQVHCVFSAFKAWMIFYFSQVFVNQFSAFLLNSTQHEKSTEPGVIPPFFCHCTGKNAC
jgi:hypothetical protein